MLFGISLNAEVEPVPLSFQQLDALEDLDTKEAAIRHLQRELTSFHKKKVLLRGFLWSRPDGRWVLSSQPAARSCCYREDEPHISQQIFLEGAHKPTSLNALQVIGTFLVAPIWDDSGKLVQLYRLEDFVFVSSPSFFSWITPPILFGLSGIMTLLFAGFLVWKNGYTVKEEFPHA
jgi:hypothetical protein